MLRPTWLKTGILAALPLLTGCWNTDPSALPYEVVPFEPEVGDAPEGWVVQEVELDLQCPDGRNNVYYFVYEEEQALAMPVAIIYHSGAFDYVAEPETQDPTAGDHLTTTSRLDRDWTVRQVFTLLGMFPDRDRHEEHDGSLVRAFADRGYAMVFPTNCWGDLWHNKAGVVKNDLNADAELVRNGRTAAEWGYRIVADSSFDAPLPDGETLVLPFQVDTSRVVAVGLGDGSRAVSELMSIDDAAPKDEGDFQPTHVLLDSPIDDLRSYYAFADLYENILVGLDRVFPNGEEDTLNGSFAAMDELPTNLSYVYSEGDGIIPSGAHEVALERIEDERPNAHVVEVYDRQHVILNNVENKDVLDQVLTDLLGAAN